MSVVVQSLVVSDSLRPSGPWHTKRPCPSLSPGVSSNSRALNRCCYPAISSSAAAFSFCPQSFPASESFPMSQLCVCACVCVCDIVIYKQWWCYFFLCNLDSYYFCLCFFSFFCLIAVTSTSSGLPWWLRWVMRVGILVLLPVLGEIFSAFHHWWCLLWVCLFIMLR